MAAYDKEIAARVAKEKEAVAKIQQIRDDHEAKSKQSLGGGILDSIDRQNKGLADMAKHYSNIEAQQKKAVDEQGAGYDIAQKEYHAGGWNGRPGPYRASSAVGLALPGFKYFADKSANYDQFNVVYDQYSTAGWGEYLSNLLTVIAVPTASTTTRAALVTMLNAMAAKAGTSAIKAIV